MDLTDKLPPIATLNWLVFSNSMGSLVFFFIMVTVALLLGIVMWFALRRYREGETLMSALLKHGAGRRYRAGYDKVMYADGVDIDKAQLDKELTEVMVNVRKIETFADGLIDKAKEELTSGYAAAAAKVATVLESVSAPTGGYSTLTAGDTLPTSPELLSQFDAIRAHVMTVLRAADFMALGVASDRVNAEMASLTEAVRTTGNDVIWSLGKIETAGASFGASLVPVTAIGVYKAGLIKIIQSRLDAAGTANNSSSTVLLQNVMNRVIEVLVNLV